MAKVLYIEPSDEISDVVDAIRNAHDNSVALVLPAGAKALQTPLNLKLVTQFSKSSGITTSIVSGDQRIQQMARGGGFPVYTSVQAFERGIELSASPAAPAFAPRSTEAAGGVATVAPPELAPPAIAPPAETWMAPPVRPLPPKRNPNAPKDRQRALTFGGIALAALGLLLFVFVSPSATIKVTIAATPLSVNPILQGSTDAAAASQPDHLTTQVVTADAATQFTATPTGTQQIPAAAATGTVVFETKLPSGVNFTIPKGEEFDTADGEKFFATADTPVTIPPPTTPGGYSSPSNSVPVQGGTAEAKSNVGPGTINKWPTTSSQGGNPCSPGQPQASFCSPSDLIVLNQSATTGGADAKTVTIASAQDITTFTQALHDKQKAMTDQVNHDMLQRASGKVAAKDPTGGGSTLNCEASPPLPKANDQYATTQISISCHGKESVYSADDVKAAVLKDLGAQVPQGDVLASDKCKIDSPKVISADDTGIVRLSAAATCYSHPDVSISSIKSQLTGKSPDDASKIIRQHNIATRSVQINESPFRLFFLPFFDSRITMEEEYVPVAQQTTQ